MVPLKVFPDCVICHVICPIMAADMPAPIIDPLESETLPIHVPDSDADGFEGLGPRGFVTVGDCAPQAARASRVERVETSNKERIDKHLSNVGAYRISRSKQRSYHPTATKECRGNPEDRGDRRA